MHHTSVCIEGVSFTSQRFHFHSFASASCQRAFSVFDVNINTSPFSGWRSGFWYSPVVLGVGSPAGMRLCFSVQREQKQHPWNLPDAIYLTCRDVFPAFHINLRALTWHTPVFSPPALTDHLTANMLANSRLSTHPAAAEQHDRRFLTPASLAL